MAEENKKHPVINPLARGRIITVIVLVIAVSLGTVILNVVNFTNIVGAVF